MCHIQLLLSFGVLQSVKLNHKNAMMKQGVVTGLIIA